jgi:prevent-host-death family protein
MRPLQGHRLPVKTAQCHRGCCADLQLKAAKATLWAVVDRAVAGEPIVITRHGRQGAVLISSGEWECVSKVPSFAVRLLAFPRDSPKRSRKPARALRDAAV